MATRTGLLHGKVAASPDLCLGFQNGVAYSLVSSIPRLDEGPNRCLVEVHYLFYTGACRANHNRRGAPSSLGALRGHRVQNDWSMHFATSLEVIGKLASEHLKA